MSVRKQQRRHSPGGHTQTAQVRLVMISNTAGIVTELQREGQWHIWFSFTAQKRFLCLLSVLVVCLYSEELASYQRELEVLSQQFSLRCLENGHLVQALDAERKALCQCQQENQDLRTRNQVIHSPVHPVFLFTVSTHKKSCVQNQQVHLLLL